MIVRRCIEAVMKHLSGEKTCIPDAPVCFVSGECEGILLETVLAQSADDCLLSCNQTSGCRWFSFQMEVKQCTLLESCNDLDTSCSACQSGERRCIDGTPTSTTTTSNTTTTTSTTTTTTTYSTTTTSTKTSSPAPKRKNFGQFFAIAPIPNSRLPNR